MGAEAEGLVEGVVEDVDLGEAEIEEEEAAGEVALVVDEVATGVDGAGDAVLAAADEAEADVGFQEEAVEVSEDHNRCSCARKYIFRYSYFTSTARL